MIAPSTKVDQLLADSQALPDRFTLFRIIGIGSTRGGAVADPDLGGYHLQSIWMTFLYLPVGLLGVYLATWPAKADGSPDRRSVILHRKLSLKALRSVYGSDWIGRVLWASTVTWLKSAGLILGIIAIVLLVALPFVNWIQSNPAKP